MESIPEIYAMTGNAPGEHDAAISEVERLANEFEAHESREQEFLKRYKDLAGKTDNRMVKLLLRMIISDEEKHHAITHAMASTLKGDLAWTSPADAIRGLYDLKAEKESLLGLTDEFIRVENEGIDEYRLLIKESKGYYRDLFALLFRSMIRDSEKHVEILQFLREALRKA